MSDIWIEQPELSKSPVKRNCCRVDPVKLFVLVAFAATLFYLLLPAVQGERNAAQHRSECRNNLKQIGMALHNYHDEYGCFPPPCIADKNGRPAHSWRVLLLPFMDETQLYNEYRFDEPWNGPHNSTLAGRMPRLFHCPSDSPKDKDPARWMTSYVAVIGPQTMWPGDRPIAIPDITDGLDKTIGVVETFNSGIHWMEPRDLQVLQMAPIISSKSGQGISSGHLKQGQGPSAHAGGATVLLMDGAVRFLPDTLPPDLIRALLTRNVGESVGDF